MDNMEKASQMHFLGTGFLSFPALEGVRGEQTQDMSCKHLLLLIIIVVIIVVKTVIITIVVVVVVVVVIKHVVGG